MVDIGPETQVYPDTGGYQYNADHAKICVASASNGVALVLGGRADRWRARAIRWNDTNLTPDLGPELDTSSTTRPDRYTVMHQLAEGVVLSLCESGNDDGTGNYQIGQVWKVDPSTLAVTHVQDIHATQKPAGSNRADHVIGGPVVGQDRVNVIYNFNSSGYGGPFMLATVTWDGTQAQVQHFQAAPNTLDGTKTWKPYGAVAAMVENAGTLYLFGNDNYNYTGLIMRSCTFDGTAAPTAPAQLGTPVVGTNYYGLDTMIAVLPGGVHVAADSYPLSYNSVDFAGNHGAYITSDTPANSEYQMDEVFWDIAPVPAIDDLTTVTTVALSSGAANMRTYNGTVLTDPPYVTMTPDPTVTYYPYSNTLASFGDGRVISLWAGDRNNFPASGDYSYAGAWATQVRLIQPPSFGGDLVATRRRFG